MALRNDIERSLLDWAAWRRSGGADWRVAADCREGSAAVAGTGGEAFVVEAFVASLPPKLHATVLEVYVNAGPASERPLRLGCPETTIMRRLGRVHLLLADRFVERQGRALRQRERVATAAAAPDGSTAREPAAQSERKETAVPTPIAGLTKA